MKPAFIRCSRFEIMDVVSRLKADDPARYWVLADEVPELDADSVWLGAGSYKVALGGITIGYFVVRVGLGGFYLGNCFKLPGNNGIAFTQMVIDWLTRQYPGAMLYLDCFRAVKSVWLAFDSALVIREVPFDPVEAPLGWSATRDGFQMVSFIKMRLSGHDGEGSY